MQSSNIPAQEHKMFSAVLASLFQVKRRRGEEAQSLSLHEIVDLAQKHAKANQTPEMKAEKYNHRGWQMTLSRWLRRGAFDDYRLTNRGVMRTADVDSTNVVVYLDAPKPKKTAKKVASAKPAPVSTPKRKNPALNRIW